MKKIFILVIVLYLTVNIQCGSRSWGVSRSRDKPLPKVQCKIPCTNTVINVEGLDALSIVPDSLGVNETGTIQTCAHVRDELVKKNPYYAPGIKAQYEGLKSRYCIQGSIVRSRASPVALKSRINVTPKPGINVTPKPGINVTPKPGINVKGVPLYRYWKHSISDHFYTTDIREIGHCHKGWEGKYGYYCEGIVGYILKKHYPGTHPLYRYWNAHLKNHFYTTKWGHFRGRRHGYKYEGITGYLFQNQKGKETLSLYRYWNHHRKDHFYTGNYNDLEQGKYGYKLEVVEGHILKKSETRIIEVATVVMDKGWENFGESYGGLKMTQDSNGLVSLSGLLRGDQKFIARLPRGKRPKERLVFSENNDNQVVRIDITPTGQVIRKTENPQGWISLSNINFLAEGRKGTHKLHLGRGWKDYGHTYAGASYHKSNGIVYLSGLIHGGPYYIGRLPTGMRPSGRLIFSANNHGRQARIDILPDGRVFRITRIQHSWVSLSSISFVASTDRRGARDLELVKWSNYGHSYAGASAVTKGKRIYIQGLIRGNQRYIATLPWHLRPKSRQIFSVNNHGRQVRVDVLKNGQILRMTRNYHRWLSLSNINFETGITYTAIKVSQQSRRW